MTASVLSALLVNADKWADISIIHTVFSYLVFISLGVNEGLGQRIVTKKKLYNTVFYRLVHLFLLLSIISFVIYFLNINFYYFLYLSGTFSLLLFSLVRIYFRGVGNLRGLSKLYWINSITILLSPVFIYLTDEPKFFIYLFIVGSCLSSFIAIKTLSTQFDFVENNIPIATLLKKAKILMTIGFPIMLAGVVFEVIISVDRFYLDTFHGKSVVGNIGLSLMIVKGGIMLLSILNTVSFKALSKQVSLNNIKLVKKLYTSQVIKGLLATIIFVTFMYIIISSNWFVIQFSSYAKLSEVFIYQSLILLPFTILFPLSVISNFKFGGTVYLTALLGTVGLYLLLVFTFHVSSNQLLTNRDLSLIVFSCLSLSVIILNLYTHLKVKN